MAVFKEIAKYFLKEGSEKAVEKYGSKAVKAAKDSLRRDAARKRKAKEKAKKTPSKVVKTPTSITRAKKAPVREASKEKQREQLRQAKRATPEEGRGSYTTVIGEGVRSAKKSKRRMSPKKARREVEQKTGETREELERRISREASQMGVGTASGPAGPAKPKYNLAREQASDALRGRYDVEDRGNVEQDLVEMLTGVGLKKGGKVAKARGCGAALRGYGRVVGGRK
ncbi:MAG: hypothetical protein VW518_01255 [Burkholderiaceae bacterium]